MELSQLYEMQKALDARIIAAKELEGVDLLPNTVLALQVEIAELANCWRGFKHWSNDRSPRTEVPRINTNEAGELVAGTHNPLLEEYADCLAFFLCLANLLELQVDDLNVVEDELEGETVTLFTELLQLVGMIPAQVSLTKHIPDITVHRRGFRAALGLFYGIGEQRLGFTYEQITAAYVAKNEINHGRQSSGY